MWALQQQQVRPRVLVLILGVWCAAAAVATPRRCSVPSSTCLRGSPGTPGPGKSTLKKFDAEDAASSSLAACCAAALAVDAPPGVVAWQLVAAAERPQECWLMADTAPSKSMRQNCTSAAVIAPPPAPTPLPPCPPAPPTPLHAGGVCLLGEPSWLPTCAGEPYEKYVQLSLEWADVQPQSAQQYTFSSLTRQLQRLEAAGAASAGLRAIVKLQSDQKPAWIYEQIPSTGQVWSAENWDNRTAMYWHPTYIRSYLALVAAFARFCTTEPLAVKYIDFTRQSWCAIGEEGLGIPNKPAAVAVLRKGSAWDVPEGCTEACAPPPDWSEARDEAYQRVVLAAYNSSYGGGARGAAVAGSALSSAPRLLVRTNTPEGLVAPFRAQFRAGRYGWFHTGAGMEETQCFNQSQRYVPFRRDCLAVNSTTVCFAEECGFPKIAAAAKQKYGMTVGTTEAGYWIVLSNMNSGVSISGLHGSSILNPRARTPELTRALAWATGYMGMHTRPRASPGAWVAFRGDLTAGPDDGAPGRRDYTFLMRIIAMVAAPVETQCGGEGVASQLQYGTWCRVLSGSTSAVHLALTAGVFGSGSAAANLRLVYLSDSSQDDSCTLQVWSATPSGASLGISQPVASNASSDRRGANTRPQRKAWAEASTNISAVFGGHGPRGADVWLTMLGGSSCQARVHMLEVRKVEPPTVQKSPSLRQALRAASA